MAAPRKPRMRGVMHDRAFFVSLLAGVWLVLLASTPKAAIAAAIFAASVSALLGVSALYHRHTWSPRVRARMRRLDHSMIFVLIAGTYTPFCLLVLDGQLATIVLAIAWVGAIAGSLMELAWAESPKWIMAVVCIALGWVAIAAMPTIFREVGTVGSSLLALGGILYTIGAVVYAAQRPNPIPGVFGYHEVFHLLVVFAITLQYAVIAFFVLQG